MPNGLENAVLTVKFLTSSPHDLALAEDLQAQQQYAYYHFADRFDGNALHFDMLKPGVAVTTNALHVLALRIDLDDTSTDPPSTIRAAIE